MNPIPIIWQKRLSWVPYFNWFFIFVRLFRPLKGMVRLMAWLLPVIYVRVSIRAQETPGWWQY